MKKTILMIAMALLSIATQAQTLKVSVGNVTYLFPASQTGEMTYTNGTSLTIMGKTFTVSDISNMTVENIEVTNNLVTVDYSGSSASVTVAGNVAQYVTPTVSGAHVTIAQSNTVAVDDDEITYQLSGETSDGEFALSGSYKCTVSLAGLTLTNPNGAAINITNGKRIQISAKKGTVNTLADGSNGSQKACIYSKGQIQLQGNGTLNVVGNSKHAIKSGDYISVKNLTLNITSAVGDGINCEEYFQMKSGTVTISGTGDDGIQCDLGGESSTGETADHEDEDSGNIYLEGGELSVSAAASAAKCIKSEGDIVVSGGTITLNANGAIDLTDVSDPSYTTGMKADGNFTQTGGSVNVNVSGAAGRGVVAKNTLTTSGGSLTVVNNGATASSSTSGSRYFCTAKGLKGGVVNINGGNISVTMKGAAAKAIKADSDDGYSGNLTISDGVLTVTTTGGGAYDATESDAKGAACLKSDGNMAISGGTLTLKSTGTGGKAIKADGTLTISNGVISATTTGSKYAYSSRITASPKAIKSTGAMTISGGEIMASSSSHEGIESKSTMTITGGYVFAMGGDDALNSSGDMNLKGGYIFGWSKGTSTGADGFDANGNLYIQGATVYGICHGGADVAFDANTEGGKSLYVQSGNLVGISGLERDASLSQSCYQASSFSKGTWYGLYSNGTLVLAFQVPSTGTMGTPMVVSTSGTATLQSGISVTGGTKIWDGYGYIGATVSGGTSVRLDNYSNSSGGGHGGGGPGGGWRW